MADFLERRGVYRVRDGCAVAGVELPANARLVYFEWTHAPADGRSTWRFARAPRDDGPAWARADARLHYLQPAEQEWILFELAEEEAAPDWPALLERVAPTEHERRVLERQP